MTKSNLAATISKSEWLTRQVRLVELSLEKTQSLDYIPGQFISVHLPDESSDNNQFIRRSYSIANIKSSTLGVTRIEIVVGVLAGGIASEFFVNAQPGTQIEISGPYGALILPSELPERLFLVATSTGVAPYRTFLPQLELLMATDQELDVELIFGIQKREDCFFCDDFREFANNNPRFQLNICYSRHDDSPLVDDEYSGYVQARLDKLVPNPESDLVFLCGNPNMIDFAFNQLTENGFSPRQVKREKYILSKR